MIDFSKEQPEYIKFGDLILTKVNVPSNGKFVWEYKNSHQKFQLMYYKFVDEFSMQVYNLSLLISSSILNKSYFSIPSEKEVADFKLNQLNKQLAEINSRKAELEKQIEELKKPKFEVGKMYEIKTKCGYERIGVCLDVDCIDILFSMYLNFENYTPSNIISYRHLPEHDEMAKQVYNFYKGNF